MYDLTPVVRATPEVYIAHARSHLLFRYADEKAFSKLERLMSTHVVIDKVVDTVKVTGNIIWCNPDYVVQLVRAGPCENILALAAKIEESIEAEMEAV